jgi:hypothetical protein
MWAAAFQAIEGDFEEFLFRDVVTPGEAHMS